MGDDTSLLQKTKRLDGKNQDAGNVAEEIISIIYQGKEAGIFTGSEADMIRNVFAYGDKNAKDIMTHRKNIIALDGEESIADALSYIAEQNNSRLPIYLEDIDTIVGILHLRDAVKCYLDESMRDKPIKELQDYIRPVSFIPETRSIDRVFKQMQHDKNHMVIVIDEYGQTAGLVAMEDIIEVIVGNILDEYDDDDENIVAEDGLTYLVRGMTLLDDLADALKITFDIDDCETLNGFLVIQLDHIPSAEENCEIWYKGYHFRVLTVENNIIQTVKVEKIIEEC